MRGGCGAGVAFHLPAEHDPVVAKLGEIRGSWAEYQVQQGDHLLAMWGVLVSGDLMHGDSLGRNPFLQLTFCAIRNHGVVTQDGSSECPLFGHRRDDHFVGGTRKGALKVDPHHD